MRCISRAAFCAHSGARSRTRNREFVSWCHSKDKLAGQERSVKWTCQHLRCTPFANPLKARIVDVVFQAQLSHTDYLEQVTLSLIGVGPPD